MNAITIAHLSDIHYAPSEISAVSTMLREKGVFVEKLLPKCLDNLKIRKPDIILITGDLTHESPAEDFRYLKNQMKAALPDTPVLCTIGNHDIRSAFRQGFLDETPSDAPYYDSMIVNGYQFVSLDSAYVNGLTGYFTDEALDYLEEKLKNTEVDGTILMMHHPFLAHARHLKMNMNDRLEKILRSGKIKAIFNGHVHGSYTSSVFGIPQFTADSLKTCFDIHPDCIAYNSRAGYEIVSFDENGDWMTERFLLNPEVETYFKK